MEKIVIIGSGCAGLTAAIYTARAGFKPVVIEGLLPGGQITTTTTVENFPGFPDGIEGYDLIDAMRRQAEKFGAQFRAGVVEEFEHDGTLSRLKIEDEWLETRSLILACGAVPRYLGIEGEQSLIGRGLTACATCDGAFYRDVPVCVVGGGDSACEEAQFLTRFASKVYLVHRRDTLRASRIMAERALANPKIEPLWNTTIVRYLVNDDGNVRGVVLRDTQNGAERELAIECVFMAIGHDPSSHAFRGKVTTSSEGYILQSHDSTATNLAGVFAAGDVADSRYRQAITAAGQGCAAALDAGRYLDANV